MKDSDFIKKDLKYVPFITMDSFNTGKLYILKSFSFSPTHCTSSFEIDCLINDSEIQNELPKIPNQNVIDSIGIEFSNDEYNPDVSISAFNETNDQPKKKKTRKIQTPYQQKPENQEMDIESGIELLDDIIFEIISQNEFLTTQEHSLKTYKKNFHSHHFFIPSNTELGYILSGESVQKLWSLFNFLGPVITKDKIEPINLSKLVNIIQISCSICEFVNLRKAFKNIDSETAKKSNISDLETRIEPDNNEDSTFGIYDYLTININCIKSSILIFELISGGYLTKKSCSELMLDSLVKSVSYVQTESALTIFELHPNEA
ncbi:hypothetical protein AYI69_g9538 [Smittium culicis]|uniref:Uncharacterized protein n=1 Tax=Smittium culicis TaxID=133412 RepID=A0A1R1XBW1_9FUNG|nr:hypothetical protein AYI69_g9538 [Smittium culicis]